MHKYHILYKTICLITDKFYIGVHSTNELEDGYLGSGVKLRRSVAKYGRENHVREILNQYETKDSLYSAEKDLVNKDLRSDPKCLNIMDGGKGGFISEEQQRHRSVCAGKASWARVNSDPVLRANFRSSRSKQMKKRHSEGLVKYDNFSGKAHTEETKSKMRDSKLGKGLGKENSQFGTCWIYSEVENKKINKLDLDKYLSSGWTKGRKMNFNK